MEFEIIEKLLGRHQGLNADWSSCTWHIADNFYLIDNEVDGFDVIVRDMADEDWEGSDFQLHFPYSLAADAVNYCKSLIHTN